MSRYVLTLLPEHVGKSVIDRGTCDCCGTKRPPIHLGDVMGRVLSGDVGKRVYYHDGVLQVENDDQLRARLAGGGSPAA